MRATHTCVNAKHLGAPPCRWATGKCSWSHTETIHCGLFHRVWHQPFPFRYSRLWRGWVCVCGGGSYIVTHQSPWGCRHRFTPACIKLTVVIFWWKLISKLSPKRDSYLNLNQTFELPSIYTHQLSAVIKLGQKECGPACFPLWLWLSPGFQNSSPGTFVRTSLEIYEYPSAKSKYLVSCDQKETTSLNMQAVFVNTASNFYCRFPHVARVELVAIVSHVNSSCSFSSSHSGSRTWTVNVVWWQ